MAEIQNTQVTEVEFENLGELFGETGASNIMIAENIEKKPSIFSPMTTDTTFLDKGENFKTVKSDDGNNDSGNDQDQSKKGGNADDKNDNKELNNFFNSFDDNKSSKNDSDNHLKNANEALEKLIEEGKLFPFDDDKPISEYTGDDIRELIEANLQEREKNLAEEVSERFYQSLPPEMQKAYEYIANGGRDLKGLFRALADAQETFETSIDTEQGQEKVVRTYLQTTGYGTPEEIEEEIISLKDRGDLEKKAAQFKPKLDAMTEQIVEQKIIAQEQARQRQAQQARMYQENLYKVLEKGELNGIRLEPRVQDMLFAGLIQPNYPSISGKPTNLLGHLLEKYQWVEPRHDLIAEALYLLSDPEGYREKVKAMGEAKATQGAIRMLKTEQTNRTGFNGIEDDNENNHREPKRIIQRPKRSFFSRD